MCDRIFLPDVVGFGCEQKIDVNYAAYFTESFGFREEWYGAEIPHRNLQNLVQFITFRLADSLPQNVLAEIELAIESLPKEKSWIAKRKKYQYWLDRGFPVL